MLGKCISLPLQLEDLEVLFLRDLQYHLKFKICMVGTRVDIPHHTAFCPDTGKTIAEYMDVESSTCQQSLSAIHPGS